MSNQLQPIKRVKKRSNDCAIGDELDKYIGSRIQAVRLAKNITQKGLLKLLPHAITQQQLSRYEQGVSPISSKLLFQISLALGVTTETFMPVSSLAKKNLQLPTPTLARAIASALKSFSQAANIEEGEVMELEKLLKNLYKS